MHQPMEESATPEDQTTTSPEASQEARGVALAPVVAHMAMPVIVPVLRGTHEHTPGDEVGESLAHWRRLLYVALGRWPFGLAGPTPFGSLAVPAPFAASLLEALASAGYETRMSDAYSAEARMLTFWRAA
jgi:hypothetical protein